VVLALPPRPVIEADDTQDRGGKRRRGRARQQAQDGAIAESHPQSLQQSLAAPAAQRVADEMPHRPEALRVLRPRRGDPGQAIGKKGRAAAPTAAAPAADVHAQRDGSALRRQILQRAPVATVPGTGPSATGRAPCGGGAVRLHHHALRRGRHPDQRQRPRTGKPFARRPGPFHRYEPTLQSGASKMNQNLEIVDRRMDDRQRWNETGDRPPDARTPF
jgi:hypothetical protein